MIDNVKAAVLEQLKSLRGQSVSRLLDNRYKKFAAMGRVA